MKKIFWPLLLPLALIAQCEDEQFLKAKKKFNPWYTGPLVTSSATAVDPGWGTFQPYAFVTDNFARYNERRRARSIPNLIQLNPEFFFQAGILSWLDTALLVQTLTSWQSHQHGGSIGDTTWTLGFSLAKQSRYVPNIKITLGETFPTGRYQNLRPKKLGTDNTGAGSYQTIFGLAASKVILWTRDHPMNLRLQLNYAVGCPVTVHGLNNYGGAPDTHGKVRPGNTFKASLGGEYSLSQRWVFATDVVYIASGKNKFHGFAGTLSDGSSAAMGNPSSDQLSIAPALEYNLNQTFSLILGGWATVYGRNSLDFAGGFLSFSYFYSFID